MFKKENRFISIISRVNLDKSDIVQIQNFLRNNLNWNYIFRRAEDEGVSSLIYCHLGGTGFSGNIPKHILEKWKLIYKENFIRNKIICEEAEKILRIFNEENINMIVLKGVFLSKIIYKNIALRPFTDIDILIKKEDITKANRILNSLGYASPPYYEIFLNSESLSPVNTLFYEAHNNTFLVHLHWHLINTTWPVYSLVRKIDMRRIFSSAEPIRIDGIEVLNLAPHHLLIYLAQHSFNHCFDRLILLIDILEVLRHYKNRIDWDFVNEEAERFNLSDIVYYSLYYASKRLGIEIDELKRIKAKRNIFLERAISLFIQKNINFYMISYLTYLFLQDGLLNRLNFIRRTIFPPYCVMVHNLILQPSRLTRYHYYRRIIRNIFKLRLLKKSKLYPKLSLRGTKCRSNLRREVQDCFAPFSRSQ